MMYQIEMQGWQCERVLTEAANFNETVLKP